MDNKEQANWKDEPIPELGDRSWNELEVKKHESGRLLFKDQLRRKNERGELEAEEVRVWVPVPEDNIEARAQTRLWFRQREALDPERDKDLFDEMEQMCLLARAVRTAKPPHGQHADHEELARYDEGCLQDILGRIQALKQLIEPRESVVDEHMFWLKVVAIRRRGDLLPLTDIAGHEQPSFIVRMAREACHSPRAKPYVQSSEISTPEPSPSESSSASSEARTEPSGTDA
jgi:hypothetical protein